MNLQKLLLATLVGSSIVACGGGGDNGPSPTAVPTAEPTAVPTAEPTAEPTQEPQTAWTCPEDGSLYFCDDFEDGTFDDKWDDLISTYALDDAGEFDILDEGTEIGKSLRFTAGTRGDNLNEGELILVKAAEFSGVPNDYSVEYKIRPRANGNTGNKYLYSMVRYQSSLEWYFGGLNMQNTADSCRVEAGIVDSGGVGRESQVTRTLELGTQGETDGIWYTVRVDVVGNTLTTYLNGEEQGTWEDTGAAYNAAGLIGFFTYNRSFEVDYVKVGDPAVKPVQLSLDYADTSWLTAADGDPLVINVTAMQSDGITADTFTVVSSDDTVASVSIDGNAVTLTPESAGDATITFTADSDSSVQRVLSAEIEPAWIMPTTDYGDISGLISPSSSGEYVDSVLTLEFDTAPTLASTGEVRIFDAANDEIVDRIKVVGESDELGYAGQSTTRTLTMPLISVDGSTLVIKPHSQALAYDKSYYVTIGENVVTGVQLNGVDFDGLGKDSGWAFSTKASGPDVSVTSLTVDDDGSSADFRTVQGALDWVMENADSNAALTINLQNGTYNELLFLRGKNNLSIVGESRDGAMISAENSEGMNGGSSGRALFLVEGVDMLTLETLTIKNTHIRTGSGDQAETIYFNSSSGRLIAKGSAFISEQDTLLLKGYNWFYDCLIAGNVDFIWGYSVATVFESSEIRSLGDSKSTAATSSGGYLLQARTANITDPGFVFLNSTLTQGASPTGVTIDPGTTYLARSSGKSDAYDNISFINSKMDAHVADIGWAYQGINDQPAPNPTAATADSGWREYGSMDLNGDALDLSDRCDDNGSCYTLSAAEVESRFCSRAQIFASFNANEGWDPYPEDTSDDACPSVGGGNDETWAGAGLLIGDSTQSSASLASGTIDAQTDTTLTFTASDGKFENQAQSFYLISQEVTGDFTITAKLKTVGDNYAANQFPVGLMMCECDALSGVTSQFAHASIHVSGTDWVSQYGHILEDGDNWGKVSGSTALTPGDNLYLKLERQGQAYYASISTDGGTSYTSLGASTFTGLPDTIKVGAFAAPYNDDQTFTFEDIQITQ